MIWFRIVCDSWAAAKSNTCNEWMYSRICVWTAMNEILKTQYNSHAVWLSHHWAHVLMNLLIRVIFNSMLPTLLTLSSFFLHDEFIFRSSEWYYKLTWRWIWEIPTIFRLFLSLIKNSSDCHVALMLFAFIWCTMQRVIFLMQTQLWLAVCSSFKANVRFHIIHTHTHAYD